MLEVTALDLEDRLKRQEDLLIKAVERISKLEELLLAERSREVHVQQNTYTNTVNYDEVSSSN